MESHEASKAFPEVLTCRRCPLMPQIIAEKKLLRESSAQIRIICGRKEVFRANPLVELS
jgi:hypothetical protein